MRGPHFETSHTRPSKSGTAPDRAERPVYRRRLQRLLVRRADEGGVGAVPEKDDAPDVDSERPVP